MSRGARTEVPRKLVAPCSTKRMGKVSCVFYVVMVVCLSLGAVSVEEYAHVTRMLGGGRAQLQCYDGVSRQGLIRGTMRRRVWINTVRNYMYVQ